MSRLLAAASLLSLALCLSASLAGPAHAQRLGKGRSLVFVGIGGHTGEFTYPGFAVSRLENGEVGGEIASCRLAHRF